MWQRPAPTRPAPTRPALATDVRAVVVVVGAGILGLTTAVLLAEAGVDVVVIEADRVGAGTTGRTTAKVTALQGTIHRQVARAHGPAVGAQYAEAQVAGQRTIQRFVEDGIECTWERRSAITYATDASSAQLVREEAAAAEHAGLDVELVDDCPEYPVPITAAVRLDDQAQFDPVAYLQGLAVRLDEHPKARLYESTRATAVHGIGGAVVETPGGKITADHVVVATLLPIIDRGLQFAVAEPKASYCIAFEALGEPPAGMYLSASEPTRSVRTAVAPDGRPVLVVGGDGHRLGHEMPASGHYRSLEDWAREHFEVGEIVARWFAHDQVSVDHLPWAGRLSTALAPHVWGAGGFGKWGMTNATASALLLADRLTGSAPPPWAAAFAPHRLSRSGVSGTVRHNATVAADLARGYLDPGRPKAVCTHLGGVCAWNDAERTWDCPLHGSRFHEDGTVFAAPAVRAMRNPPQPPAT